MPSARTRHGRSLPCDDSKIDAGRVKAPNRLSKKLAILIPQFPGQTHAFFWRELQVLEKAGADVTLVSTRLPDADSRAAHDWAEQAIDRTIYLMPLGFAGMLRAAGAVLASGPGRILRAKRCCLQLDGASIKQRLAALALLIPAAALKRVAKQNNIEHIHVHSAANAALVAMLCRLLGGPAYSLTLHGDIATYGSGQREKWSNAAFGITVNQMLRQQVIDRVPGVADRIAVAPMGVDVEKFKRQTPYEPPKPGETWRLVTCGRLHPGKGHADLIEAVALLRDRGHPATLTILGEGSDRARLERLIDERNLTDAVTLAGSVGEDRVRDELEAAHLFALASHNEALGVATMEAMAMQLPVVVTNVGGVSELVRDGIDGSLASAHSTAAIADAVQQVLSHSSVAARMGGAGRQQIVETFHTRRSAKLLMDKIDCQI